MNSRSVVITIFTDGKDIVVQERGSHSKLGEKYGFWGGGIEEGETKEEAIKREMQEELGYVPEDLNYWGDYSYYVSEEGKYKGLKVNSFIFVSPITNKLLNTKTIEGRGIIKMSLDQAIEGIGFPQGATPFLKNFKK